MAKLAPLDIAGLDRELAGLAVSSPADLRVVHTALMRAAAQVTPAPLSTLTTLAASFDASVAGFADELGARPRTVFRLLRAGAAEAAWAVLIDNATGTVEEPFAASTSSGSTRTAWPLPLLTQVEAPVVYADLPGFRDPRFGAPDDCYDITGIVRLRHQVDEVVTGSGHVTVGGWALLNPLLAGPHESIRLVAANGDNEVTVDGRRLRRPDQALAAERRVWAGWSARLDLEDPRLVPGSWSLALELEHAGVVRRTPLGAQPGELAKAATRGMITVGDRSVSWQTDARPWQLYLG